MYNYRKTRLVFDIECFKNYFLVMFRDIDDPSKVKSFEMRGDHEELDIPLIRHFLRGSTVVSFNGNNYDIPMLMLALDNATCHELKAASDVIIQNRMKPWIFMREYGLSIPSYLDHIDLFELPKGRHSLKNYAARIGAKTLQDLPYAHDARLSDSQMDVVHTYCGHDLEDTHILFKDLEKAIGVRIAMSNQYHMDVRSKSDAQIAETILVRLIENKRKIKISKPRPEDYVRGVKYIAPDCISFKSQRLRDILELTQEVTYYINPKNGNLVMPPALKDVVIELGSSGMKYKLGMGGLHSQESGVSRYADDEMMLLDIDVGSYYPSLMITQQMIPKKLGPYFLELFTGFKNDRIALKHGDTSVIDKMWLPLVDKNDIKGSSALIVAVLKIFLNGTFGKLGSIFSKIFSPELMIRVTLTGQLMLLMLIEEFESRGIEVASANTDGIVIHTPRENEALLDGIVAAWEVNTLMEMEKTEYTSIHSASVNSYIAFTVDGKAKRKGDYAERSLDVTGNGQVCMDAIIAYIKDGTPLRETIMNCDDFLKFTNFQQVTGGAQKGNEVLGKVVRWYYSTQIRGAITCVSGGGKVPMTDGAMPCMTLPKKMPNDIDYGWYEREAAGKLRDMGVNYTADRKPKTGKYRQVCRPTQVTVHYVDTDNIAACGAELKHRHDEWEKPKVNNPRVCAACRRVLNAG